MNVQCNGCRACCKQDLIRLEPAELERFAWHMEFGAPALDRKPNGECVYLRADGCSIHGNAPQSCQRFDCRVLFKTTPKEWRRMRVQQNPTMAAVYEAGKRRLATLKD